MLKYGLGNSFMRFKQAITKEASEEYTQRERERESHGILGSAIRASAVEKQSFQTCMYTHTYRVYLGG
jgi:hypothetical protein